MEPSKKPILKAQEEKRVVQEDQPAKVIEWEDYEQELARLCSLTSALEEAKSKKLLLEEKLQSLIQVRFLFCFRCFFGDKGVETEEELWIYVLNVSASLLCWLIR